MSEVGGWVTPPKKKKKKIIAKSSQVTTNCTMPRFLLICLTFLSLLSLSSAATIRGRVDLSGSSLPVSVRLNARHYAFVRSDGTFVFRDVSSGTHELTVLDPKREFTRATVEIDSAQNVVKILEWFPSQAQGQGPQARLVPQLVVRSLGEVDYFEKRQTVSVMSFFANPMMLMLGVTLVMGMAMPKLMEGMDPEELKRVNKDMANQRNILSDPAAAFSNRIAGKNDDGAESD